MKIPFTTLQKRASLRDKFIELRGVARIDNFRFLRMSAFEIKKIFRSFR